MENSEESRLYLIGVSYKTADMATREKFQFVGKKLGEALKKISAKEEVEGLAILSTCNRMEYYISANRAISPKETIKIAYPEEDLSPFEKALYEKEGREAARHLFRVTAGLESLALGEYQIQQQVKEAYSLACQEKTADKYLHKLFHAAFRAGKKARNETKIGAGKRSIAGAASKIIIDAVPKTKRVAVIGVNENSRIMAAKLRDAGYSSFAFVNRTKYKAEALAAEFGGMAFGLDEVEKALFKSEAVFSSAGAPKAIVKAEILERLAAQERCPSVIIDAAIPRNFEEADLPESVKIYNLGDLKDILKKFDEIRAAEIEKAEKILEDELKVFEAWSEMKNDKILEPYLETFERLRQQVLNEYAEQFSPEDLKKVDKLTRTLLHRTKSTFTKALIKATNGGEPRERGEAN